MLLLLNAYAGLTDVLGNELPRSTALGYLSNSLGNRNMKLSMLGAYMVTRMCDFQTSRASVW